MRNKYLFLITVFMSIVFFYNCSEVQDDITQAPVLEGVHSSEVLNPESSEYHGNLIKDNGIEYCQKCHASNLEGGLASVSCVECHSVLQIHDEGIIDLKSDNFHGKYLKMNNWDLQECQACHGIDYSGGVIQASCLTCHTNADGPEACNTCHGSFANGEFIAPPRDLSGNTTSDSPGVGAHQSHLSDNELRVAVPCAECHTVPNSFKDPGHIDGSPNAELTFGTLASNLEANPSFDFGTLKCSNIYCHGNFEFKKADSESQWIYTDSLIVGEKFSPKWTKVDDTQAACGTCHLLPPTGHLNAGNDPDATTCKGCHTAVFNEDGSLNTFVHINGEKNLN